MLLQQRRHMLQFVRPFPGNHHFPDQHVRRTLVLIAAHIGLEAGKFAATQSCLKLLQHLITSSLKG